MSKKQSARVNSAVSVQKDYSYLFLVLVFLSCLVMTEQVLDATLVPRFLLFSGGFSILVFLILSKKAKVHLDLDIISFALPTFFLVSFVSFFWAHNAAEAYFDSLRILLGMCIFFFTVFYLKDNQNFELNLARTVSAVSLIYSIAALVQLAELNSFQLRALYSVTSLAGHKNLFSCFLFLTLPFSIYGILKSGDNWKYLFYPAFFLALALIAVLQTRAVWLGLQVALILVALIAAIKFRRNYFQHYRRILLYSGISLVVLLAMAFVLEPEIISSVRDRINILEYAQSESAQERLALWEKSLLLAKDAFPFGVGAGNWQIMFTRYSVEGIGSAMSDNVTFQRPHNDFLWVLSETGIAGITLYLVFLLAPLLYAVRLILKNELNTDHIILLIFTATLTGFLIISFFDFPRERIEIMVVFHAGMALIYHRILKETALFSLFSVNVKRLTLLIPVIALLFFSLVVSFSRWKGEYNMKKVYAYRQKGDWASVVKYCDKAESSFYQLDPTTIPVSWYKGLAYFSSGNFSQALEEYKDAQSISPYNHYILNDLGSALEKLGRHEEAKEQYKQALKINRHFDDPKLNLAAIYYNEKNYPEAWSWTIQVNDRHPRKALFVQTIKPFIKASVK